MTNPYTPPGFAGVFNPTEPISEVMRTWARMFLIVSCIFVVYNLQQISVEFGRASSHNLAWATAALDIFTYLANIAGAVVYAIFSSQVMSNDRNALPRLRSMSIAAIIIIVSTSLLYLLPYLWVMGMVPSSGYPRTHPGFAIEIFLMSSVFRMVIGWLILIGVHVFFNLRMREMTTLEIGD
jgi:hypothetical protein